MTNAEIKRALAAANHDDGRIRCFIKAVDGTYVDTNTKRNESPGVVDALVAQRRALIMVIVPPRNG